MSIPKPKSHTDEGYYQRYRKRQAEIVGHDRLNQLKEKQRRQRREIDEWARKVLNQ